VALECLNVNDVGGCFGYLVISDVRMSQCALIAIVEYDVKLFQQAQGREVHALHDASKSMEIAQEKLRKQMETAVTHQQQAEHRVYDLTSEVNTLFAGTYTYSALKYCSTIASYNDSWTAHYLTRSRTTVDGWINSEPTCTVITTTELGPTSRSCRHLTAVDAMRTKQLYLPYTLINSSSQYPCLPAIPGLILQAHCNK